MADPRSRNGLKVLSGIKPSGTLHLGNYFGAVRQHIELQETHRVVYFIADYHSLDPIRDPDLRRRLSTDIALDYLALGLDPERAILYRQSDLPEVTELCWILGSVAPMGLLERCHAYKDARARGDKIDFGLFAYPVLMAADILLHEADLVPVGQDQKQHIEVARDLAVKFNLTYGEVLRLPEPWILEEAAAVPGTDGRKMSKSYENTIEMFAPEKRVRKQIMGIVTDSTSVEEPKDPDASHLFKLWSLFATPDERVELAERFRAGGLGYGEVKKDLLQRVLSHFDLARKRREELAARPATVEDVLREGARRARESSAPLLQSVREAAGLGGCVQR
ncbi:MAG: tryptophan--tRNA ligase [Myxococcota bacterium]